MDRLVTIFLFLFGMACQSQGYQQEEIASTPASKHVGGRCEGCEAVYEYGNKILTSTDTLPGFHEEGPKLKVTGTIFEKDGQTPAENVILYIYHTDQQGIYATRGDEKGWAKRHGYIRGWIKTGKDGKYTFYTLRPGAYPSRAQAAHIHPVVKEPGINEYYISSYFFNDDPLLSKNERNDPSPRGGSGILSLTKEDDLWVAKRDIILGLNIPGYQ
ncbi:hypothetical protein C900_04989 [Fulvivirga imtechensis AK7]|uniref:Intradiol ring-cleavage dioxygenases domain-containing protein n=1 Tax=Fulvivirga imtechensis AK7 TaxID=1237149 RepID=L8JPZ9_9BACT|nr:hypothetical protein [Fulvivirga imtechensis]ELR69457.1 hypothetical protein C900_04989 [Fulvivirga imtechensis AK7]